MNDALRREHDRLLAQTQALEREHQGLRSRPGDIEAHAAHRAKLRQQIDQLHEHMRRLRESDKWNLE